jgi:tRNA(Ile)-lysidine synthase
MASSRKSKKSPKTISRIAIALSGGLDSVVLLDSVCKASDPSQTEIWVFHIHHGLQQAADEWILFCERLAKKYNVHFDFRLLHLKNNQAQGNVEARARAGRYEALEDLCVEHDVKDLFLAHHQNDQAETILLQLLRGSGVAGMAGMPQKRGLGKGITLWRPLLDQSRVQLEAYAKKHKLKWIEDPSNADTSYRRNAIRNLILPKLIQIQPEAVVNLARSAQLMAQTQGLLDRLAEQDGIAIYTEHELKVPPLKLLAKKDLPAANNILRYWLKSHDLCMPSQERLQSWWSDLHSVKPSAQLEWQHDGVSIRLWRGKLQVTSPNGQENTGEWVFKPISVRSKLPGISLDWVKEAQSNGSIELRKRSGAEKLQIKPSGPRKTLKNLFQELQVPPWERQAPLLYINGELIAVAGVGVSYPHLALVGPRVWPQWLPAT